MLTSLVGVVGSHLLLGAGLCKIVALIGRRGLDLRQAMATAALCSVVSGLVTVLVFVTTPLHRMPAGILQGGLFTVLIVGAVFTALYLILAASLVGVCCPASGEACLA